MVDGAAAGHYNNDTDTETAHYSSSLDWLGKGYNSYTDTHCGAVYTDYTASIIRAKHGVGGSQLTARRTQTS